MTEEQKIKCEEIINSYKEKYEKEIEEINTSLGNINSLFLLSL